MLSLWTYGKTSATSPGFWEEPLTPVWRKKGLEGYNQAGPPRSWVKLFLNPIQYS